MGLVLFHWRPFLSSRCFLQHSLHKVTGKKCIDLFGKKHTPQTVCAVSESECVSVAGNMWAGWWVGGLFLLFWGRGGDFQVLGHCLLLGLWWSLKEFIIKSQGSKKRKAQNRVWYFHQPGILASAELVVHFPSKKKKKSLRCTHGICLVLSQSHANVGRFEITTLGHGCF